MKYVALQGFDRGSLGISTFPSTPTLFEAITQRLDLSRRDLMLVPRPRKASVEHSVMAIIIFIDWTGMDAPDP